MTPEQSEAVAQAVRFACSRLPALSREDREDVMQEATIACAAALTRHRGRAQLATFLDRVARHAVIDWLRRERRRLECLPLSAAAGVTATRGEEPFARACGAQMLARVAATVAEMPPRERLALSAVAAGLSGREAARALGCSLEAARSLRHRSRTNLAARLEGA